MTTPVISSSYTITNYNSTGAPASSMFELVEVAIGEWPVSGALVTSSLDSDKYFVWVNGGFQGLPAFPSEPDTIQYLGEPLQDQIILAGYAGVNGETYSSLTVASSSTVNVGDQLTFGAETVDVFSKDSSYIPAGSTTLYITGAFSGNVIGKQIGTDISITAGGAPVSGSNYVITNATNEYTSLRGINGALWPVSGAYVEYQGNTHWLGYDSYTERGVGLFANSLPIAGTDVVTFISESTTNGEVTAYDNINYALFVVGDMPADLLGYQIEFNSETKYIVSYGKYDGFAQILVDSAFTTSPVGEIYGSGLTLGTAPVTGQILGDTIGATYLTALNAPSVDAGDTLTYLGETKTIVTVDQQANLTIQIDSPFSNSLLGKVLGVDITIAAGDGGVYTKPTKPAVAKVTRDQEVPEVTKDQLVAEVTKPSVGKVTIG